jgi:hypothetical protein
VARFVDALFDHIAQLQQPPRNPKWRDTVISARVLGLERFKAAQDWLDGAQGVASPSPATPSLIPARSEEFRQFLVQRSGGRNVPPEETARLYNDFLRWRDSQR